MNELIQFVYQGKQPIRTVVISGEPWFVAKDVCDVLEHSNPAMAVKGLDDDEKGISKVYTPSGDQDMAVVSESGLYSLVIRSNKPEAKAFKRWITHEVIPSIRKTGSYGTPRELTRLELIEMARESELGRIEESKKRIEAEQRASEYQFQLQEQAPKVLFADAVTTSHDTILIRDLAKVPKQNGIDIGAKRLFEELRERGFLIKQKSADYNSPTQRAMELGLFQIKETPIVHSDGHVTLSRTPKVTGKGQVYFVKLFKRVEGLSVSQ